jgi:hypothetical protein
VPDRGGRPGLVEEPVDDLLVVRVLGQKDLDRGALADQVVLGQVDDPHPPFADLSHHPVTTELLTNHGSPDRDVPLGRQRL